MSVLGTGCVVGAGEPVSDAPASTSNALQTENGLSSINGLSMNGLSSINGLSMNGLNTSNGLAMNGLSSINGLSMNGLSSLNGLAMNGLSSINGLTMNGLSKRPYIDARHVELPLHLPQNAGAYPFRASVGSLNARGRWLESALREQGGVSVSHPLSEDSGLGSGTGPMATAQGQLVSAYLVRCALPPGRSLQKFDAQGNLHELTGAVGVAPEWENGTCDEACQEWVSACLLAHVNLTGVHVPIWLTASNKAIDWATSADYPNEEAAYFGNLFASEPTAFVCFGKDRATDPIPGRVCVSDATCPYADPYLSHGGNCEAKTACSLHTEGSAREGYDSCRVGGQSFSHVVTVWKR